MGAVRWAGVLEMSVIMYYTMLCIACHFVPLTPYQEFLLGPPTPSVVALVFTAVIFSSPSSPLCLVVLILLGVLLSSLFHTILMPGGLTPGPTFSACSDVAGFDMTDGSGIAAHSCIVHDRNHRPVSAK